MIAIYCTHLWAIFRKKHREVVEPPDFISEDVGNIGCIQEEIRRRWMDDGGPAQMNPVDGWHLIDNAINATDCRFRQSNIFHPCRKTEYIVVLCQDDPDGWDHCINIHAMYAKPLGPVSRS